VTFLTYRIGTDPDLTWAELQLELWRDEWRAHHRTGKVSARNAPRAHRMGARFSRSHAGPLFTA
jgi:hypothetical protein